MEPGILLTPFEEMDLRIIRAKIDMIMKSAPETRIMYNAILNKLSEKEMEIMERGVHRQQKIDSSQSSICNDTQSIQ